MFCVDSAIGSLLSPKVMSGSGFVALWSTIGPAKCGRAGSWLPSLEVLDESETEPILMPTTALSFEIGD